MSSARRQEHRRGSSMRAGLIAILIILILLLGAVGYFVFTLLEPVGAPTSGDLPSGLSWVRSIYGYGAGEDQRFIAPAHVDIADDGTIWVSDTQMNAVMSFSPDGTPRSRIGLQTLVAEGQLSPKGIEVGDDGRLYVCANNAARLVVLSVEGEFLDAWEIDNPLDVTLSDDRVFVTSPAGVTVFSSDGEVVGTWGGRGKAEDELDVPQGIVVGDDGVVYVADTLNSRVKAFTQEGQFLWATAPGTSGGGNVPKGATETESDEGTSTEMGTGFQLPAGLCMDANGRLVLADPFGFEVVVLDPAKQGEIVGRYGEFGSADGFFAYPLGMAYDAERDWFAVADVANARVQIVRIGGSGDAGLLPAARRATSGPIWICCLPLGLLLLILLAALASRRRSRNQTLGEDGGSADTDD